MHKQIISLLNLFTPLFILILLSDCDSRPLNLSDAKREVKEYYESGAYEKEMETVIDDAIEQLEVQSFTKKSAAVFDVDETVLDNYQYSKEVNFGYEWNSWNIFMERVESPPVPHMKRLYSWLVEHNVHIIFLTGRRKSSYNATIKNLTEQGFAEFDTLICRNENEYKIPVAIYKSSKRKLLIENGYKIAATIGDQWEDLRGEHTGLKINIPNYLYLLD